MHIIIMMIKAIMIRTIMIIITRKAVGEHGPLLISLYIVTYAQN